MSYSFKKADQTLLQLEAGKTVIPQATQVDFMKKKKTLYASKSLWLSFKLSFPSFCSLRTERYQLNYRYYCKWQRFSCSVYGSAFYFFLPFRAILFIVLLKCYLQGRKKNAFYPQRRSFLRKEEKKKDPHFQLLSASGVLPVKADIFQWRP